MGNSLQDALALAGLSMPEPAVDVSSLANVDGMTVETPVSPEPEIPEFLRKPVPAHIAPAPPPTPVAPVVAPVVPVQVNTVVPAPAPTPEPEPEEAPETNVPINPNADKAAVMRAVRVLGENEGKGANARPAFLEKVSDASRMGAIVEDDAQQLYALYAKSAAAMKGIGAPKMGSEPQQVSKVKTMIKLGALPNIRADVLIAKVKDAIKVRRDAGDKTFKKSPVDCILTAARMQIDQPQFDLSDAQIEQSLDSKVPDAKIEADMLYVILDRAIKLHENDENPLSDESKAMLAPMMKDLDARIKDLGGTTAQQKAEAKAKAALDKAQAKLNKASSAPLPGGVQRY